MALAVLIALTMGMLPVPASAQEGAFLHPSIDADANGLDDALDAYLAQGSFGPVKAVLHLDHHPTPEDVALLKAEFGVQRAYVFRQWDAMQVELDAAQLTGVLDAPGVLGVEKMPIHELTLAKSVPALRVRAASGVAVHEGIDHALAVHESLGFRGEGMVVAVLDSGVDNAHESLDDLDDDPATDDPKLLQRTDPLTGLAIVAGYDATPFEEAPERECINPAGDGHGTAVASIAVGTGGPSGANGGVAPAARIVEIDVNPVSANPATGSVRNASLLKGLDWILSFNRGTSCYGDPGEDRIDVVTMSVGTDTGHLPHSIANRMINRIVRDGVVFVAAGGNVNQVSGTCPVGLVNAADGAILVGGSHTKNTITRVDDRGWDGSCRGPRLSDEDADHLDELRPDLVAPGFGVVGAAAGTLVGYVGGSGTSFAAPFVAGVAALMLQANPALRSADLGSDERTGDAGAVPVRDLLEQTAQHKDATEAGAPDVRQTGRFGLPWNNAWGYGLLDGYAAVRRAMDPTGLLAVAGGPYVVGADGIATLEATATGGQPPYSFAWNLGDRRLAQGATVSHTYAGGDFAPFVTVTDVAGAQDVATTHVGGGRPSGFEVRRYSFDSPGCQDTEGWFVSPDAILQPGSDLGEMKAGPGSPWHLSAENPASPPCAWYHGLDATGQYLPQSVWNLDSPGGDGCLFLPPGSTSATLVFALAGESEPAFDVLRVQVRAAPCLAGPLETIGQAGTFETIASYNGRIGNGKAFETEHASLNSVLALGGGQFQVRFRFESDVLFGFPGYHVDDVRVLVENQPPVLSPIAPPVLMTTDTLHLGLSATDPDGDPLRFGANGLPEGANLDSLTGVVAWSPGDEQDGVHDVIFTVSDGLFSDEQAVRITVLNVPPAAYGNADREDTDRLTDVKFTDGSSDPDGAVVAWAWEFGDGTTSSQQHPTHRYARLGNFHVNLTVTDDDGASDRTEIGKIKVKNIPPRGQIGPGDDNVGSNAAAEIEANRVDAAQFEDFSTDPDGHIVAWQWNFGDGSSSEAQNPSHQYTQLGTFTARLTVTDNDGGVGRSEHTVRVVNLAPSAAFGLEPRYPMVLALTDFADASTDRDGFLRHWAWDLGDGASAEGAAVSHRYLEGGWYTVRLRATDNDGGAAETHATVYVCSPGGDVATLVDPSHVRLEFEACIRVGEEPPRLLSMGFGGSEAAGLPGLLWLLVAALAVVRRRAG